MEIVAASARVIDGNVEVYITSKGNREQPAYLATRLILTRAQDGQWAVDRSLGLEVS